MKSLRAQSVKTNHYKNYRNRRASFIKDVIGEGTVIARFTVDKGHKDGPEIHEITSTGIINVYNQYTHRFVTQLIARPQQIYRYYEGTTMSPPTTVIAIAAKHQRMGYNHM